MESSPVRIRHFSDILCVWAYVGQIRVDELQATFGDLISMDCHFMDVFGDALGKIASRWSERGGVQAYAALVQKTAAQHDHIAIHPELWTTNTPTTSTSCHVFLRAVKLLEDADGPSDALRHAAWKLRETFFVEAVDVSARSAQLAIAEQLQLPTATIEDHIDSGRAFAALSRDAAIAREHDIKMSPTFVLNEGRQHLRGNVGYRVIEANIRELLHNPAREASWC